jgi:hypothetical protein
MRKICSICEHIFDECENDLCQPTCDDCAAIMLEDDGQPSEYEEWQDYMGGDDWDYGQYDDGIF